MVSLAAPMNNRFALCIMFGLAASPALAADGSLSLRFSDSTTGSQLPAG